MIPSIEKRSTEKSISKVKEGSIKGINKKILEQIELMGEYYSRFLKEWEKYDSSQKGFFGLRDFYNYVKYVCKKLEKEGNYI